jgi:hypothetical protein
MFLLHKHIMPMVVGVFKSPFPISPVGGAVPTSAAYPVLEKFALSLEKRLQSGPSLEKRYWHIIPFLQLVKGVQKA